MMSPLAFIAIVFGAMLFVLGLIPNVIAIVTDELQTLRDAFMNEMQNLRGDFSPIRGPIHRIQADSVQGWLLVCGGVLMILGLLGLLANIPRSVQTDSGPGSEVSIRAVSHPGLVPNSGLSSVPPPR